MRYLKIAALTFTFLLGFGISAFAQWDDVYFDPDKDVSFTKENNYSERRSSFPGEQYDYSSYDSEYEYYNDYDFYYSSRIRRFRRPYYGFGFYDPIYVDAFYYDPFFTPSMTMLIYDDFYANRVSMRYRPWASAYNASFAQWNGIGARNWFSLGFGYPAFGSLYNPWFGYTANYYCPPTWGGGNFRYNNVTSVYNDVTRNVTFAPRRNNGGAVAPRSLNENNSSIDRQRTARTRGNATANERVRGANNTDRLDNSNRSTRRSAVSRERKRSSNTLTPSRTRSSNPNSSRVRSRSNNSRTYSRPSNSSRTRSTNRLSPSRNNSSRSTINRSSNSRTRSSARPSSSTRSRSSSSSTVRKKN